MDPVISIIIPTCNRVGLLLQAVERLILQIRKSNHLAEIIVVDDGSDEPIEPSLVELTKQFEVEDKVRIYRQNPSGPAVARNLAIKKAQGKIVLFLGDDVLALPNLLSTHINAHLIEYPQANVAVLGIADLPSELSSTPFVKWWKRWNFRYYMLLEQKRSPDFSFFYTNNLSLKKDFLLERGLFDEAFRYPAYEDGELGYRLINQGLELIFKPEARAEHYHPMDFSSACKRMITRGKGYDLFVEKTGMLGMSQLWLAIGSEAILQPWLIKPLSKLAKWMQDKAAIGLVYIPVLMYYFQIGRGKRPHFRN